jgi:exosortase E/protease (VPEID-CTERM system)
VLPWLALRCIPLVLLLLVEIVAYWSRFESPFLAKFSVAGVIRFAKYSLSARFAITAFVGLILFGRHELRSVYKSMSWAFGVSTVPWRRLMIHLATLATFFQFSIAVLEGPHGTWAHRDWWIGVWLATALSVVISWLVVAMPITLPSHSIRTLCAPIVGSLLLACAALFVGQLTHQLWPPLANGTLCIVQWLLTLVYPVVNHPNRFVIGTDAFSVFIAPRCSGYEGIGLIAVFLIGFFSWFRKELRFPQSLLLFPLGIAAIWFANALRIAILIAIGTSVSPDIAVHGFHTQAGWLAFNAIAICIVGVAWNSAFFSKNSTRTTSTLVHAEYPAAPYLVPLLVLIAASMVTTAFSDGSFERLYPLRVIATAAALLYFGRKYRELKILQWDWSWPAVAIGVTVFGVWMILEPLARVDDTSNASQLAGLRSLAPWMFAMWITFRAIGSVITVPLAEELAFRGFLSRRLIAKEFDSVPMGKFTAISFVLSSVVFGLLHGRWLAGTVAGLLFSLALYHRRRLADAVLAHATANLLITTYVLTSGNWSAWS